MSGPPPWCRTDTRRQRVSGFAIKSVPQATINRRRIRYLQYSMYHVPTPPSPGTQAPRRASKYPGRARAWRGKNEGVPSLYSTYVQYVCVVAWRGGTVGPCSVPRVGPALAVGDRSSDLLRFRGGAISLWRDAKLWRLAGVSPSPLASCLEAWRKPHLNSNSRITLEAQ